MLGKNNNYQISKKQAEKKKRFSLKKLSIGLVSLAAGTSFMFSSPAESVQAEEDDDIELDYDDDYGEYDDDDYSFDYDYDDDDDWDDDDWDDDDWDDDDWDEVEYDDDGGWDVDDSYDDDDYNEVYAGEDDEVEYDDDYSEYDDDLDGADDDWDDYDNDDEDDDDEYDDDDLDETDDDEDDDDLDDIDENDDDDLDNDLKAGLISRDDALERALADAGVQSHEIELDDSELDEEDGQLSYEVEFEVQGVEYEYLIDVQTGAVIEREREGKALTHSLQPSQNKKSADQTISQKEALKVALMDSKADQAKTVRLDDLELKHKSGRLVYEIEFDTEVAEFEYLIDAQTAQILEVEREGRKSKAGQKEKINQRPLTPTTDQNNKPLEKLDQMASQDKPAADKPNQSEQENTSQFSPQLDQKAQFASEVTQHFHDLVNAERQAQGLAPLSYNEDGLQQAAQVRTEEIINSFSHTRPNGQAFNTAQGFESMGTVTGENIQQTYLRQTAQPQDLAQELFNNWKNSAGHYANMMSPNYKQQSIGLAFVDNGQYIEVYSSQNFSN